MQDSNIRRGFASTLRPWKTNYFKRQIVPFILKQIPLTGNLVVHADLILFSGQTSVRWTVTFNAEIWSVLALDNYRL